MKYNNNNIRNMMSVSEFLNPMEGAVYDPLEDTEMCGASGPSFSV